MVCSLRSITCASASAATGCVSPGCASAATTIGSSSGRAAGSGRGESSGGVVSGSLIRCQLPVPVPRAGSRTKITRLRSPLRMRGALACVSLLPSAVCLCFPLRTQFAVRVVRQARLVVIVVLAVDDEERPVPPLLREEVIRHIAQLVQALAGRFVSGGLRTLAV